MAENILNGGISQLEELKKDLRSYNTKNENLTALNQELNKKEKELSSSIKKLEDDIEKTIKKRREEVAESYNKEIVKEQEKLKSAKNEKSKAKSAQVKDRIKEATAELTQDNERIKKEIKEAIAGAGAPGYVGYNWYYLLYMPQGVGQYAKLVMLILLAFIAVPAGICFLLPEDFQKIYFIVPVYGIIVVAIFLIYNAIEKKTLVPYNSLLLSIRDAKQQIKKNKKKIKKITRKISKDNDDDVYELDTYKNQIKERELALENISDRKEDAIKLFNKNTKPEIEKEINDRYNPTIEKLNEDITKLKKQVKELSEDVKEEKLFITGKYEAYIGKEFMKEEKVEELINIMKSDQADTVSLAIQVSKARR